MANYTFDNLISSTHTEYINSDFSDLKSIDKYFLIDDILKNILFNMKKSKINNVSIKKEDDYISLFLNDKKIYELEFNYNLSNTDKFFINNTINYMYQYEYSLEDIDISI